MPVGAEHQTKKEKVKKITRQVYHLPERKSMKGLKVKDIAAKFGLSDELVRNLCHARGQRFATRLVPNGRWYIDDELFQEFWERKQEKTRETRGTLR